MWNVPEWMKVTMYGLTIIGLAIMAKGIYDKLTLTTRGTSLIHLKAVLPRPLNWPSFFQTLFFQGKIHRNLEVGFFHSMIFYGFVVLWIATDVVAIHYDTPFKIFQGPVYIIISFLADFGGFFLLIGLALAYYRRYIRRPNYLSATRPKQELFMYIILLALVIVGFVLEGIRILGTGMPQGEKIYAPFGYALALLFGQFALSETTWASIYRGLWFFHMANTALFIASIGHSKFFHIFLLPIQALITPKRRGGILGPIDFEDENAETFGLGKLSEFTLKNRLDMLACVECGRCTLACPADASGKPLDPKLIITKARDLIFETQKKGQEDAELWNEAPLYSHNELDSCTTCGACIEECPASIEHIDIIMQAKRYKALTLGQLPATAASTINKIKVNGNPWGISQEDRFNWAEGHNIPVITSERKVEYLYYVGCAGAYDSANQKIVRDTIALLKKAGVEFAVMGKNEKCNGDPVRRFGDEYTFFEMAIENIANIRQYQFDKIVTHCPHCLHTIGKEYARFENGKFETIHHTELLAELVKTGRLKPHKALQKELTFHDPCYLGRHHGEYDAPRKILESIPGVKIQEMEKSKDTSFCCGMGGGNMWYELPEGESISSNRLRQVGEVQVSSLATSCPYCLINFNSSKTQVKETEDIEIEDVASLLAKATL